MSNHLCKVCCIECDCGEDKVDRCLGCSTCFEVELDELDKYLTLGDKKNE